jgi:hypothetical protein
MSKKVESPMNGRASLRLAAANSAPPASAPCERLERQVLGLREAVDGGWILGEEPQQRIAQKHQRRRALGAAHRRRGQLLCDVEQLARVRRPEGAPGVDGESVIPAVTGEPVSFSVAS